MAEKREYVPLQPFVCEKCGAAGDIERPANLSPEAVTMRLANRHALLSPECADEWGVSHLRLAQTAPLPD